MSVNAAADAAVERAIRPAESERIQKTSGGKQENPVAEATKRIARNVPTEVIGTYLVVIGLFAAGERTAQWVLYWLFVGLTGLAVWVAFAVKLKKKSSAAAKPAKWPWWGLVAGVISFAIWAMALPGSVWTNLDWYDPKIGGAAVLVWAFVVGLIGSLFEE